MVVLGLYRTRLAASSLIEVITASVLIAIVFGSALLVFLNIAASSGNLQTLKHKQKLQHMATQTILDSSFLSEETLDEEGYIIHKTISTHDSAKDLIVLHLKAVNQQGQLIAEYRRLIYLNHE